MYCIKCGVELAESEDKCPLCGTRVYHPDIEREQGIPLFPDNPPEAHYTVTREGKLFVLTSVFLMGLVMPLVCDLSLNRQVTWSGIVMAAVAFSYVLMVLPFWFKAPNPVVFVPADHAACALFLLYINQHTGGHWFMRFAFPTIGCACIICTAVVALCKYVRKGYLFIFSGAMILTGMSILLVEHLLNKTFGFHDTLVWSIYPCAACLLTGLLLMIVAVNPRLREALQKKFFV